MRFSDYEANVVFLYRCPLAGLTLWEALQHVEDPNINKPSVTVTDVGVSQPIVEEDGGSNVWNGVSTEELASFRYIFLEF